MNDINSKINEAKEGDNELDEFNNVKNSLDKLTQLVLNQKENINKEQKQLFDDIQNTLANPLI